MLWPMVLRTRMSQHAPRRPPRAQADRQRLTVTVTALLASPYLGGARWLAAAGMAACLTGAVSRWCLRSGDAGQAATHGRRLALLAGNAWLIAALAADPVAPAAGTLPD